MFPLIGIFPSTICHLHYNPPMSKPNDVQLLKRSMGYLRPYAWLNVGIYTTMLLINLISILFPQFIRWSIDVGIYGGDLALLGWAVLLLLALTLVKGIFIYYQGKWTEIASQGVA